MPKKPTIKNAVKELTKRTKATTKWAKKGVKAVKKAVKKALKGSKKAPKKSSAKRTTKTAPGSGSEYTRALKDSIVKRLNERIASIVRHAGTQNEEVMRWQAKLTRPNSPYISKDKTYDPNKIKTDKNKGHKEKEEYKVISRSKKDLDKMELEDLQRLERQTRGWGTVKQEAREALEDQARMAMETAPFAPVNEADIPPVTDEDIVKYIDQKQSVREFIESHTEAFYALIEATGWDDIRDHTTEEIYNESRKIDMATYKFKAPLGVIGADYIRRREAARERRRQLGV